MAKDELIVGRENFPQFAGSISVELLDMRLDKNMFSFLNLSTIKFRMKKFFCGKIFCEPVFDRESFHGYKFKVGNQLTACRGDLQA